jgi:hypothetical protein
MRYQDHIIEATKTAFAETFRYAKGVPADKTEWKPLDSGRSVLDVCQELARTPIWTISMLNQEPQDWSPESMAKEGEIMATYATIEECERIANENLAHLYELCAAYPDDKLAETMFLPFEGGRDFSMQEIMDYPRWNATYHLGQIAYIQTLYGDKAMY